MSSVPDERLRRLLGGEKLASLRRRMRQRFERTASDEEPMSFRLGGLSADEHGALAALLGRPPHFTESMRIDVRVLDAALREAQIADSLRDALEQLDGPLVHLATARHQRQALWAAVVDSSGHPALMGLLRIPGGLGLLKRLADGNSEAATQLCSRTSAVLQRLPAQGLARAQLAADVLGDAHALDNRKSTATLVLAVWRQILAPIRQETEGIASELDLDGSPRKSIGSEKNREVWARAGVLVNELARPALFLNLPMDIAESYPQILGEPAYVSLRALLRAPIRWPVENRNIYVCENPNLLAIAAERLGSHCSPMVCTDGVPAAAQRQLLMQLTQSGANLLYHGDFDWAGIRIGNQVMREFNARPWRFGAADYVAGVQTSPRPGHPLRGEEVRAQWDETLHGAMQEHQLAIAEEGVAASMLQDLEGV